MNEPPRVHDRATVAPGAVLDEGVVVGPNVVIEADVHVGAHSRIEAGTILLAGTRIGARCTIGPSAVIGGAPMDHDFRGEPSEVRIGDGTVVREFATIHRATGEGEATVVGARSLIMCYVHVSHNCRVGVEATITNASQLAGHSEVGDYAVLGAAAMVHQFVRVGAYAMLGATAAANRDVLPYVLSQGRPARNLRPNRVNLQRRGVDGERYRTIEAALRACRDGARDRLEGLAEPGVAGSEDVRALLAFLDSSRRGISRFGDLELG